MNTLKYDAEKIFKLPPPKPKTEEMPLLEEAEDMNEEEFKKWTATKKDGEAAEGAKDLDMEDAVKKEAEAKR